MRISCILAAGSGGPRAEAVLAALEAQTHPDREVIVVAKRGAGIAGAQEIAGGGVGAAWARGLAMAGGEAALFLTPEDLPMPWALSAMARPAAAGAELVLARRLPAPGPTRPDAGFDALVAGLGAARLVLPGDPDFGWHMARAAVVAEGAALRLVSMALIRRASIPFLHGNRHAGRILAALAVAHARGLGVVASACATGHADPPPADPDPFAAFDAPAAAAVLLEALGRVLRPSDARLRPALVGAVIGWLRDSRRQVAHPLRAAHDAACAAVCADAPAVLADLPEGEALGPVADRAALAWFAARRQGSWP
ncbi:MAG: hypothetical protein KatS3mg118_0277 [Paracoccaceae bacterium]|nr:MAG: hypothetical protein KatS3mg118_0277 [Paracoccaceae bacterium]